MSIDTKKAETFLSAIDGSVSQLTELEQSYKQQKERITSDLTSHVHQLVVLSDTQATRAQIIRELYWHRKLSTDIIAEAFGVTSGKVRFIAGSLTVSIPCSRKCGNSVKKTYTSKLQLEHDSQWSRYENVSSHSLRTVCEECEKKENEERQISNAQEKKASLRRNAELRNMIWEDFIDTEEWISIRNTVIHNKGYKCSICRAKDVGLHIHPPKDTPQDYPPYRSKGYEYYVLCTNCLPRCSDLINKSKGEYVKREFMGEIMDWNQQR